MNLTVYTDGASRGNPGKSGAGVLILDERKQEIASLKEYLGIATNNEAEYKALIIALEYLPALLSDKTLSAAANPAGSGTQTNISDLSGILFLLDSQLLVFQMNGIYSVKSANILPLYNKAKKLINSIKAGSKPARIPLAIEFRHIPRELNKEADRLANLAIDTA
jgi:ribonuclease HI